MRPNKSFSLSLQKYFSVKPREQFSYDAIISRILLIGYNVVCRLKNGNIKYLLEQEVYPQTAIE
jgi:hypothetical protein